MKDFLKILRGLPEDIKPHIAKLLINRWGVGNSAYMITKDIPGYLIPNQPYTLTEIARTTLENHNGKSVEEIHNIRCTLMPADQKKILRQDKAIIKNYSESFPPHLILNGYWEREEYIETTEANVFGGFGDLYINEKTILEIPIIEAAPETLGFYNSKLFALGETITFEGDKNLPMLIMEIGATYAPNYMMHPDYGQGAYLEYHKPPNFWVPMSSNCGGFIILAKKEADKYIVTGFKIPFGYAVYTPPYVIHCDGFLTGEFFMVYSISSNYSTVILKDTSKKPLMVLPQS